MIIISCCLDVVLSEWLRAEYRLRLEISCYMYVCVCFVCVRFALDGDNVAVTGLFSDHHSDLVCYVTDDGGYLFSW